MLYLDEVTRQTSCVKLQCEVKFAVENRKPIAITIFDYYMPSELISDGGIGWGEEGGGSLTDQCCMCSMKERPLSSKERVFSVFEKSYLVLCCVITLSSHFTLMHAPTFTPHTAYLS